MPAPVIQNPVSTTDSTPRRKKSLGSPTLAKTFASALFSPKPAPEVAEEEESIVFDWGDRDRDILRLQDAYLMKFFDRGFDIQSYTMEQWVKDVVYCKGQVYHDDVSPEQVAKHFEKVEIAKKAFFYKELVDCNGSKVGAHPAELVPYPLSYDVVALKADRFAYELLRKIYYGRPSIHMVPFANQAPKRVLDLGCGQGSWIIDAAQYWKDTKFYGIDIQKLHPTPEELVQKCGEKVTQNITFMYRNFLCDKLPFRDSSFDMVRLANLKWCIPEDKWDELIQDVHRVTARAGLVEIIDEDFVAYTDPESEINFNDYNTCQAVEAQFTEVLHARKLPLDTHEFMFDKLQKCFSSVHQDVIPVAISPEMEARPRRNSKAKKPITRKKTMIASILKRRRTGDDAITRAGDESEQPAKSPTKSCSSPDSSLYDEEIAEVEREDRPLPLKPQPAGLMVLDRFIPYSADEILHHAIKNMQNLLSCKETARDYLVHLTPDLKLKLFQYNYGLLSEEDRKVYKPIIESFTAESKMFEDLFWTYERTMADRLGINIPHCDFDDTLTINEVRDGSKLAARNKKDDDDEERVPSRPLSTFADIKDPNGDFAWDGGCEQIAQSLEKKYNLHRMVRVIRVYTTWK